MDETEEDISEVTGRKKDVWNKWKRWRNNLWGVRLILRQYHQQMLHHFLKSFHKFQKLLHQQEQETKNKYKKRPLYEVFCFLYSKNYHSLISLQLTKTTHFFDILKRFFLVDTHVGFIVFVVPVGEIYTPIIDMRHTEEFSVG